MPGVTDNSFFHCCISLVPKAGKCPSFPASINSLPAPGNWTMQEFGRPHYTNAQMPFPNAPPDVPDENRTGIYRREFSLPEDWRGRRIVSHFDGCEGVLHNYVNGQPLGLSKDARTPAEFDVTGLVRYGGHYFPPTAIST